MKSPILKNICWLVLCCFMLISTDAWAQKRGNKDNEDKEDKEKPANARSNNAINPAVVARLNDMTREEKNTMTVCPLHGTKMKLSDNYRANASDFRQSGDYPFAYQLNYRRSCPKCTNTLHAEEKAFEREERKNQDEATNERCLYHNDKMFINGEYNALNYEKNPDETTPNAQQYRFKYYCKKCTKDHKLLHKHDDEEEDE